MCVYACRTLPPCLSDPLWGLPKLDFGHTMGFRLLYQSHWNDPSFMPFIIVWLQLMAKRFCVVQLLSIDNSILTDIDCGC